MKKMLILTAILSFAGAVQGLVFGLQLGDAAFGFGHSKSGGFVLGVGRAPDNDTRFSAIIVPGDKDEKCCCSQQCKKKSKTCCTRSGRIHG